MIELRSGTAEPNPEDGELCHWIDEPFDSHTTFKAAVADIAQALGTERGALAQLSFHQERYGNARRNDLSNSPAAEEVRRFHPPHGEAWLWGYDLAAGGEMLGFTELEQEVHLLNSLLPLHSVRTASGRMANESPTS